MHRILFPIFLALVATRVIGQGTSPAMTIDDLRTRIAAVAQTHPRLIADAAQFDALRASLGDSSSTRKVLANAVIRHADLLADVPPIRRELQGRRLLGQSRRCVERMLNLSMAYQLTGEMKYVERGKQEMLTIAEFADWNPSHYLDVAEMTLGMAIGYDWMFDALDDASRRTIRRAIKDKGVSLPFTTQHNKWVRATNNWGQVCHCGMTAGALAILEDEPELAVQTVHNAIQNLPRSMKAFAPHGSYPEGPGYWAYGTSFNVMLLAMLDGNLGSDFELSQMPGFDETGQYLSLVTGPSGATFNYADGGASRKPQAALYWFARRYQRPDWLLGEDARVRAEIASFDSRDAGSGGNRLLPLALLWIGDDERLDEAEIRMPLHWQSESSTPVAVHRSSWTDPRSTFVGLKAGSPSAPHGQMDTGSFVLDADGVRWALDLGAEGYHGIESRGMNLWSAAQDSDRWTIFRQSNAGHNTLVIDGKLQVAKGHAEIVDFSSEHDFPHSIADLSPVYRGQAGNVRRGVALLPSREVVIQDELDGLTPGSRVRWGMITPSQVESPTGATLQLTQHDRRLQLTIVEPRGATWSIVNTEQPRHEWDSPNPGTQMVAYEVEAPASGELRLVVVATPGSCDAPSSQRFAPVSLSDW
ncbi:heparinase II/III family protein [Stieleria sp. ICT_E10.1]|uniref:heparinase II/III domain-containing protein n=1 Tax=Stieleria sedimenti TaxID=2976331 RepID=UPI0021800580|nr:heparinase II/III family protein [Stieleria sedimenti]MCS7470085.1 heparinase II/III family protein [Stieleria sedimenti]